MTILTVKEVAELLRMSKRQVYELTKPKDRPMSDNPLPTIRVNGNLRFDKESVERWLKRCEENHVEA